jgi:hypothetical protein
MHGFDKYCKLYINYIINYFLFIFNTLGIYSEI